MKLLVKEYLSSLKERGELDAILPDLLSELGLHVYSRPAIGTRQNGVDLAAVGIDDDKVKKIFLLTVKSGNLTRNDWNGTAQSLRPSLDEIIDSYIPRRIPNQYKDLKVAICICTGGDISQNIDTDLSDYENRNSNENVEFQRWDGDKIANLLLSAALSENILPSEARSVFRKSIALHDEPDTSYDYFVKLLRVLDQNLGARQKDIITAIRQVNLCVWILYVWSRSADNIEAPYKCSELAVLWCWKLTSPFLENKTKQAKFMSTSMDSITRLHLTITEDLLQTKYLPFAKTKHGLSIAVSSNSSVDVNLKLFQIVGRIALSGLWFYCLFEKIYNPSSSDKIRFEETMKKYEGSLIEIFNNNGTLRNPILDAHSIDLNLVCMFLVLRNRYDAISSWTGQVLESCAFAIKSNGQYPTVSSNYQGLISHPSDRSDNDYFESATTGSTLFPSLIVWQKMSNPSARFFEYANFFQSELAHCTLQLWVPDELSETHIYTNSGIHGLMLVDMEISDSGGSLIEVLHQETINSKNVFDNLSSIRLGFWPILLCACHHHRNFIPINFWEDYLAREAKKA